MKKVIILLSLSLCFSEMKACDICGCGAGNNYIGILPEFTKKIFGMRYRYNVLRTHIGAGGVSTYLTTKEYYRTAELWSGWKIGESFRLMATVPFQFDEKQTNSATKTKSGLGDISAAVYYEILNKRKSMKSGKLLVQSLWAGTGIKMPTGKYETADKTGSTAANLFQLGTGSTDFSLNAMYDIRLNDLGLNTTTAWKINTENRDDYRYGNKFSAASQAYYKFRINNKLLIAPAAGVLFETASKDLDNGFRADLSGGNVWLLTGGAEFSFKKIAAGFNFQSVMSQHMAAGFVQAKGRGMLHIAFAL